MLKLKAQIKKLEFYECSVYTLPSGSNKTSQLHLEDDMQLRRLLTPDARAFLRVIVKGHAITTNRVVR